MHVWMTVCLEPFCLLSLSVSLTAAAAAASIFLCCCAVLFIYLCIYIYIIVCFVFTGMHFGRILNTLTGEILFLARPPPDWKNENIRNATRFHSDVCSNGGSVCCTFTGFLLTYLLTLMPSRKRLSYFCFFFGVTNIYHGTMSSCFFVERDSLFYTMPRGSAQSFSRFLRRWCELYHA